MAGMMGGKGDMMGGTPVPPEAGAAPAGDGAPSQGGSASQLVSGIHEGLSKLLSGMSQSGAADQDDTERLTQIISEFESFVEGLGGSKEKPTGNTTPEAGSADVKPAM